MSSFDEAFAAAFDDFADGIADAFATADAAIAADRLAAERALTETMGRMGDALGKGIKL